MFSLGLNIYVQSRVEHRLLENPYKSMFLSLYSLYLLKGFPQYKGRVVFFEKNTQKISTLLPLYWGIRRELIYRQAEQTKNENVGCSTWINNYTRRTASSIVLSNMLTPYVVT
jgi:hypothetical protein